ncbi:MAG: M20 family metallo-hydrolase [Cyclobacteriaceae bacterium]
MSLLSEQELSKMTDEAVALLQQLINTPSFSKEEQETADLIEGYLIGKELNPHRKGNNVWVHGQLQDKRKPTLLLNSHHDTVKPSEGWTRDPFTLVYEGDKLIGLGSNDAGASVVALVAAFQHLNQIKQLPYNLILAITAEEEISGANGISSVLPDLGQIDLGIIGEPTGMQMAVAEKGLMVLDCIVQGKAGHAAREEGENALYKAMPSIDWIKNYQFDQNSELLGPVKMTVTQIKSGSQHNVVPDRCEFVVDVRSNEKYTNQEILEIVSEHVDANVAPRSTRLGASGISLDHPVVKKGKSLGLNCYGSPTLSDQALLDFTTLKIGPGQSERSHTADEFILGSEIKDGIRFYIELLNGLQIL